MNNKLKRLLDEVEANASELAAAQKTEGEARRENMNSKISETKKKFLPRLAAAKEAWEGRADLKISVSEGVRTSTEYGWLVISLNMVTVDQNRSSHYFITVDKNGRITIYENATARNRIDVGIADISSVTEDKIDHLLRLVAEDCFSPTIRRSRR